MVYIATMTYQIHITEFIQPEVVAGGGTRLEVVVVEATVTAGDGFR